MPPKAANPGLEPAVTSLGVIAPLALEIETPAFAGSLAMLFEMVRDHRLDLWEVPLAPICEAYLDYLLASTDTPLDEAAAALAVLAYVLERKSVRLIPVPEVEEDETSDFWDDEPLALEAAMDLDEIIAILRGGWERRNQWFFRDADPSGDYELPVPLAELAPVDLARAFQRVLNRIPPTPAPMIHKPKLSLAEQMSVLTHRLTREYRRLESVLLEAADRAQAAVWFLAVLELLKLGRIRLDASPDATDDVRIALARA